MICLSGYSQNSDYLKFTYDAAGMKNHDRVLIVQAKTHDTLGNIEALFRKRTLVKILYRNDQKIRGRIDTLSESEIFIKNQKIKPDEIISIKRIRGRVGRSVGNSLIGAGAFILGVSKIYYTQSPEQAHNTNNDLGWIDWAIPSIGIIIVGVIIDLVEMIVQISVPKYSSDKWKLSIVDFSKKDK